MADRNTVEIILSATDRASAAMREAFGGIEESHNKFLDTIMSGKALIAGAFTALGGYIAKTGVEYDAMLEQSTVAWTTLLGSQQQAKQMMMDLANFAKTTPFQTQDVDMMAKYLHNAGLEGKGLFDMLSRVSDVSSAFNIPAEDAKTMTMEMSHVMQSGRAYAKDLNELQNKGVPIYKAIAAEMGTTVGAVKKMGEAGQITSDIYIKAFDGISNKVKGASAAQSQTFNGLLTTLKDDWLMIAGALSKPIFDFLKKELLTVMPLMDGTLALVKGDSKGFQDSLEKAFGKDAAAMLGNFFDGIKTGFDEIGGFVDKGRQALQGLFDIFNGGESVGTGINILSGLGLKASAIYDIEEFGKRVKEALTQTFGTIKGVIEIFQGGAALGKGINLLSAIGFKADAIYEIETIANGIKATIFNFINAIVQFWTGVFDPQKGIGNSFISMLDTVKKIAMPILLDIVHFIEQEFGFLKTFWDQNGAQIIQAVQNFWAILAAIFKILAPVILFIIQMLWDNVKGVIDGALKVIIGLVEVFEGIFTGNWGKIWEGIKSILGGAIEFIWNLINLMFIGRIIKGVGGFFELMKGLFQGGWDEIANGIKSFASGSGAWFEGFVSAAKNKFGEIIQAAKDLPGAIGKGITDFLKDAVGAIGSLANELVNKFKSALGIHSPSKVFTDMGGHIISGLVNGLTSGNLINLGQMLFKDFGGGVMSTVDGIKNFLTGAFSGSAGGDVSAWLQQAMGLTGVPASWLGPLSTIAQHESSGNPNAQNHWDSNQKYGGTFGLMQMIIPTFQTYMQKGLTNILDPVANAAASINYIKSRYGSVFNVPGIKSLMNGGPYQGYYTGARVADQQLAWIAERGAEYVIPTDKSQNAFNLWSQAGKENGFMGSASAANKQQHVINHKEYHVQVNSLKADMNENELTRSLQRMEALNP